MGSDIGIILTYSAGIMIIFMLSWILVIPFKLVGKFIINALLGGLLIIIFNLFSPFTGMNIGVNEITALIVGILGVPGFITILIIKIVFLV